MSENEQRRGRVDSFDEDLIVLGRIVRAQGLRGQVRVKPFGVAPDVADRLGGGRVFLRAGAQVRPASIVDQRWHSGMWIVTLEGVETRDAAEALVGWEVCLPEADRPALGPDEFYHDDLIGLRAVHAETGADLGEIVAVRPEAAADLLEVRRPGGGWFLVPLVRAIVVEVDLSGGRVRIDPPEGLMDLNL